MPKKHIPPLLSPFSSPEAVQNESQELRLRYMQENQDNAASESRREGKRGEGEKERRLVLHH